MKYYTTNSRRNFDARIHSYQNMSKKRTPFQVSKTYRRLSKTRPVQQFTNLSERARSSTSLNYSLLSYHEVPTWMQENAYILHYYLPVSTSTISCFKNIFKLHNQTGNIWTHLLPSLIFIYSIWRHNIIPDFYFTEPDIEKLLLNFYKISALICFTCSWVYHSHVNHQHMYASCLTADISGIVIMITGCTISWLYYSFFCYKFLRRLYMSISSIFGVIFVICNTLKVFQERRKMNACLLISLVASSIIPLCHLIINNNGFKENWDNWHWKELLAMFLSYMTGTFFYIFRFPEVVSPGSFDLFFNSHQLFHIFVVFGAYFHMVGLNGLQKDRYMMGNVC